MKDFSIGRNSNNHSKTAYEQLEGYSKLKKDYQKFLKQAEKSDMANSPTLKQKQLEMLEELRSAAMKENNSAEVELIDEEIQFLSSSLAAEATSEQVAYVPTYSQSQISKSTDLIDRLNACKNSKGEIDDETRRIVLAFKNTDVSPINLSKFVEKCRQFENSIPTEIVTAVERLCASNISPNVIFDVMDESSFSLREKDTEVDFSIIDDLITYHSMGIDEISALKMTKQIRGNYEDKKVVFDSVSKLMTAGFDANITSQLISLLTVKIPETGKSVLSSQSVNSLVNMKKNLATTHAVERNERQNPINKLNQIMFVFEDSYILMKDDKVVEFVKKDSETVVDAQKEYDDFASDYENHLILDFVKKYGTFDGKIDSNALRTFTVLRNAGVSYDNLLPLVEECLEFVPADIEKGIARHYNLNVSKINTISTMKKAGALSSDVLTIVNALGQENNGQYSKEDVNNAIMLTQLVIAGKEVVALIPEVRNDSQTKTFISDFSGVLERKEGLVKLASLVKDADGNFDEEASDIIYSIGEYLFCNPEAEMKESEFISLVEKAINASIAPNSTKVDVNSMSACVAMCRNKESAENILTALELCKDEFGYPNEALADIVWDMSSQQACFEDISAVLNICKPVNGILDIERAAVIAELLDDGCSVEEIVQFAKKLGHK